MDEIPIGLLVSILGFGLGAVFGITVQRTNFCTMGAISDIVFMGSWNRFRAWALAVAVAMLGSQALDLSETVDLGQSIYLGPRLGWVGAIVGGLLFGFGMTLSSGCANKTLVRLGTGNLKSLVVAIFLGIFAYMTLRGLIGLARVQFDALTVLDLTVADLDSQAIPDLLAAAGLPVLAARLATVAVLAGGLLWFCFRSPAFRASRRDLTSGIIIGLLVPAAWFVTGYIGRDEFEPVALASFTFIGPTGDAIQYLMTFTGATINFGIAAVGGVIAGAFVAAKLSREFRIETFTEAGDMVRHMTGGAIMGIGGVLALGCTIGQGITGMSTLALGSLIAILSILAGGFFGMKYLEEDGFRGAFGALLGRARRPTGATYPPRL